MTDTRYARATGTAIGALTMIAAKLEGTLDIDRIYNVAQDDHEYLRTEISATVAQLKELKATLQAIADENLSTEE